MKRKSILMVVLVLAIVTALSAGTLAVYTTSVDLSTNEVSAKKFAITANSSVNATVQHALAPSESSDYAFEITNVTDGTPSEVDIDVTVGLNASADLFTSMPGLQIELMDASGAAVMTWTADNAAATYNAGTLFAANSASLVDYTVRTTWVDSADSAAQTVAQGTVNASAFQIKVVGTQHV